MVKWNNPITRKVSEHLCILSGIRSTKAGNFINRGSLPNLISGKIWLLMQVDIECHDTTIAKHGVPSI